MCNLSSGTILTINIGISLLRYIHHSLLTEVDWVDGKEGEEDEEDASDSGDHACLKFVIFIIVNDVDDEKKCIMID